ncbi:MAG: PepSY domain-containing protein [Loktanella sp.]|nr:PepSY domain-containing protein [Loktanella sp.]
MKNTFLYGAVAAVLTATPLLADMPPPDNALPLSEIVAMIEQSDDIRWIDEIDWDDDGYWEVEYYTVDNRRVSAKIDPVSGQTLAR